VVGSRRPMAPVAIVTDSTHYMPAELVRAQGIHEVSLYVNWGDQPERELDLPGFDSFYERLKAGREFPTTSQPSVGDYLEVYEPLIEQGSDIVSIHLSGGISGTVGAAAQAKELLEERGARDRIDVFDAQTAAGGLGGVVLAAAALARAGGDLAAVGTRAREAREAVEIWFCVDTLEYFQRGGRVGKAQAWIGGALKVKPILTLGELITPIERVRTAGRAFDRMLEYMQSLHRKGSDGWIVQHIQAPDQAQRLVAHGRELFGSEPLFVSEVGPVLGAYTGPGLLGVGGLPKRLLAA
jgi:DegV family protein with EDD domain